MSILAFVAAACAAPPIGQYDESDLSERGADAGKPGGGQGPSGSGSASSGLPCEVGKVLASKCQSCHASAPKAGAGTALVTWDDLQKPGPGASSGKKVLDLVKERIHASDGVMPPGGGMAPADRKTLDDWLGAGAPKGQACEVRPPPDTTPLPCAPDVTLKASAPYTMPAGKTDQYVCVGVDVNLTKKRHVIALGPHVDNENILHHILLFQTSKSYPSEPTECKPFETAGASKLITGWAPGGGNIVLPPEAAYPENAGTTHWMVQLHYNNAQNKPNQTDNSGFSLCTTEDLRPNDAGIVAFGSMRFDIPPRATRKIKCDVSTDVVKLSGVTFFGASPHMHTRGLSMSTERVPKLGLGAPLMVHEQKTFDFEGQAHVPISVKTSPGDVFRTRCEWKNTGDMPVGFGENTGDEMCYHFMSYYPDKGTLWHLPALLATPTCRVEP